jgi:hypothetical protein
MKLRYLICALTLVMIATPVKAVVCPAPLSAEEAKIKADFEEARRVMNTGIKTGVEIETGFTPVNIVEMRLTMRTIGLESRETDRVIWNLAHRLDDLENRREDGLIYLMLSRRGGAVGGAVFARHLMNKVIAGNRMDAVNDIIETFGNQNNRGAKVFLSEVIDVPFLVLEQYANARPAECTKPVETDDDIPTSYPSGQPVLTKETNDFLKSMSK